MADRPAAASAGGTAAATKSAAGKKGKDKEVKGPKPKAFRVQVHIIDVKDIKPPSGVMPDLVVTARVGSFGTKYTQVVRHSTSATFDAILDWKFMMTYDEMQNAKVQINVMNANTDSKSELLGMYELTLQQIRKQPMGEYFMTWLALYTDPDEYVTELCGSLRVSLVCVGGQQALPWHSKEEVTEAQNDESPQVLMPHLVRWTHYSLFIAIYRVEGLPNMDDYGSTDAFVSVKLPGQATVKSKVIKNNLNPVFNELLRLPVQLPIMNDKLSISISDYDQGGYDDLVADYHFHINDVVKQGEITPHWICLYGIKGREGLQNIRARLPHVPLDTCYKGRLLIALLAEEVAAQLAPKTKAIGPCADPASEPFVIRFDLYQASQLDAKNVPDNSQIQIELQVGGITMESTTGLAEGGFVRWDERFEEKHVHLPSDLAQCPDIFINVNYTTTNAKTAERLGYIRLDLEDVYGFNHAPSFDTLLRDPLSPKVAAVPGFLEYRLDFGKEAEMPRSERERISKPPMRKFELRAHIYQARNLPSMDEDGLANPYAVVTLQGYAGHTDTAEPTCNPQWYETVRVELLLPQPTPITSKILMRVYDQEEDTAMGGDQLIGRCFVPLLGVDRHFPHKPGWMPIWMDDEKDVRGEILVSFQLIAAEELSKVPLNSIVPLMREVEVEVNVVGVREMLSYNNQSISRPSVEIDCGDRSTTDKVRRTLESSTPSGPDANFLQTLVIRTRLPEDLLYCPQLNVRVFDNLGVGESPVVAKCSFALAPYCEWITEAEYVPNNRPRQPTVLINDELSEESDDDAEEVDEEHDAYLHTVYPDLHAANFGFESEMTIDTPSLADLRAARALSRGRLKGHRVRTLPPTPPTVPRELHAVQADEDVRIEKPLESELEHLIIDPPFDEWHLYRGTGVASGAARREVGRFKARVRVVEADLKSKALPRLDLQDLFEQSVYITRLYVTRGIKLTPKDPDGLADPFLVVRNGRHKQNIIDDVKNSIADTLNPNFYRCFELPTMVPGNPTLTIEVWDHDHDGAQLIGATSIDIESRLLSQEWLEMMPKPVERRYLWSPASLAPQGKLEMWVEVLTPPQALAAKPKVLRPPTALECQLRVVVWSVTDLILEGKSRAIDLQHTANVFVTAQAGAGPAAGGPMMQETDVHYGAKHTANFNYRFLFDVKLPVRQSKLQVQVWDERLTGANDSLAECTLQLSTLYQNVQNARGQLHEVPRQFYVCTHPFHPGQQAKLEMTISMMTRELAEHADNIAGLGRGAPNKNPYLPAPLGRDNVGITGIKDLGIVSSVKGALSRRSTVRGDAELEGWQASGAGSAPTSTDVHGANGQYSPMLTDGQQPTGAPPAPPKGKKGSKAQAGRPPPPGGVSASADAGAGVGL